jgi:signal transduction histidine kinase
VGRSEGLPSISPRYNYYPSSLRSRDGRLWFTTSNGVVAVTPKGLEKELPVPSVFVDEARVNGVEVDAHGPIEIPAGPHRVDLDLVALSYVVPENLLLRHQLEGADPDWVETPQNRSTSYSGLAPGEYRLRLAAARQAGTWIESGDSISIKVLPYWWGDPWIQLCALAAVVTGIVIGVRRWSQRQLRHRLLRLEQEHALDRERSRIARDLHDELGGSLTEANFLIERLRNVPSNELAGGLEAVAGRIRHLNMELATIVWTVSPANSSLDQLASFIRRHAARFFKHTQVRCTVSEKTPIPPLPLNPEVQHNLLAIAKECFNNALKHAQPSNVTLEMAFSDDTFHMVVTDDGNGFVTDARTDSQGNGLINMRSRAEEIGASISIVSSPGRGTTIRLSHPYFPTAATALRAPV